MLKNFDMIVDRVKKMGEVLLPYNYPLTTPAEEDEISVLKVTEMLVDGYEIMLHYSKNFYKDHYLETMQVLSKSSPFLPFNLVVKLAKKFFGNDHISLVEVLKEGKKIYCWTRIVDLSGNILEYSIEKERLEFEGFEYDYVSPNNINIQ